MAQILTDISCEAVLEEFNCYPNSRTDNEDLVVIESCNFDPLFAVPKTISADELKKTLQAHPQNIKDLVPDEDYVLEKIKKIRQTGKIPAYKIINNNITVHYVDAPDIKLY